VSDPTSAGQTEPGPPQRSAGQLSHGDIRELRGPLLVLGDVNGVGWDEFATVDLTDGQERHALVLEVDHDLVTLQVLEGTDAMSLGGIRVRFAGRPLHIPVGTDWLGRVCNGRGEPLDGGPPVTAATTMPVSGWPLNPVYREPPAEPVLTGISVIDALTTLVQGQKLRRPPPAASPSGSCSRRWA
jgi:V/A-type H+-transporting ATPase subunit B